MKIALIYDFDKTLSTRDMQEYGFIPSLGMKDKDFWGETGKITKENEADKILAYMYMMVKAAKEKDVKLTREYLNECGKNVEFHPGVLTWFERINSFAFSLGVTLEHYIISSGITEIVEGTPIYKYFKNVFGCSFIYENGEAVWPKMAVNYTQKTQFLYRISKGVFDLTDDDSLNKKSDNLYINIDNMIYLGDGLTDIPCMKLVKEGGGASIALYPHGLEEKVLPIVMDDRVSIATPADYTEGSKLDTAIKKIIAHMKTLDDFRNDAKAEMDRIKKKKEA